MEDEMNRKEFIDKLRKEISKLPEEEIEAAIEYYEECFDEAAPEKEQELLERLGSPKKVAAQIKSQYAVRLFDDEEKPSAKKGLSAIWYVILGICSAPVSIPLAIALGAVLIAIFATVICFIIGIFAGIIGCIVSAVASVVIGIMAIPTALSSAVLLIGAGLGLLGVTAAVAVLFFMGVRAAANAVIRAVRKRNDRKRIEKMVNANERKKWRYADDAADDADGDASEEGGIDNE